jgi:alpha-galactosidase/6-phospho-beta-glucosidase family protein
LRSGHPSTTGTLLVLNLPLCQCIDNTQRKKEIQRKKVKRKKNKEAQLMTKTKERQRKVTSRAKHTLHTKNSKKAPPEQMQAPPEHVDAKIQILDAFF